MISFSNECKSIDNNKKAIILISCRFFLKRLIKGSVNIQFRTESLKYNEYAHITREDEQKQNYIITVNRSIIDNNNLLFRSIAHELIHLKQMFTGQLTRPFPYLPQVNAWKDKKDDKASFIHSVQQSSYSDYESYEKVYLNLPWEKEAHNKMDALYLEFYRYLLYKKYENIFSRAFNYFFKNNYLLTKEEKDNEYQLDFFTLHKLYLSFI